MRIMGIDPGSQVTGYGIIEQHGSQHHHLLSGCIRLGDAEMPSRLGVIFSQLSQIIQEQQPEMISIEQVFVARNAASALKLGQARGAAICAAVQHGVGVAEYAPRAIKQAVTGSGAANKAQVQHMICRLLRLSKAPAADACDALAAALCHAYSQATLQRLSPLAKGISMKTRWR